MCVMCVAIYITCIARLGTFSPNSSHAHKLTEARMSSSAGTASAAGASLHHLCISVHHLCISCSPLCNTCASLCNTCASLYISCSSLCNTCASLCSICASLCITATLSVCNRGSRGSPLHEGKGFTVCIQSLGIHPLQPRAHKPMECNPLLLLHVGDFLPGFTLFNVHGAL